MLIETLAVVVNSSIIQTKLNEAHAFLYSDGETNYFAPSRFIGYANNSIENHESNHSKDGKVTTPKISELLGKDCVFDEELEKSYRGFCQKLGFVANEAGAFGVRRKYWVL